MPAPSLSRKGTSMHFQPRMSPEYACWYCHFYEGMTAQRTAALCNFPKASRVRATPEYGCSGFQREPGSDDEPITRDRLTLVA